MVVLLYRLGRVCGCASIVPVAAIVVPARIARIIGHRKISVQRQPLTGVVRQTGAVFASLEAVAHVVAADTLAIVILDPATLDLTRARFFVARAATIPAVAYHGARGCAHGSGGHPAVALADGGAEQATGDGAENRTAAAIPFPVAAGFVANGFSPAFAARLVDRVVDRRARNHAGAGDEAIRVITARAGVRAAAGDKQGGDQGRVQKACFHAYSPCYSEFSACALRSAAVAGATVVLEFALLATFVAVAVAFRLFANGFAAGRAPVIPAGIARILPRLVGAVALGHDDHAIHEIRCCQNRGGNHQSQSGQPNNPVSSCVHRGLHFCGCLFRFHASQFG